MLGRVYILECFGKNRSSPSSKLQLREYLQVVHLSRRDSETWKQTVLQVLLFWLFLCMIKVVITAGLYLKPEPQFAFFFNFLIRIKYLLVYFFCTTAVAKEKSKQNIQ